MEIQTTIKNGLPCIAKVVTFQRHKPNHRADNPEDYYGYTLIEFDLLTRKGKAAPWLERLMTSEDRERIETQIAEEAAEI